MLNFSVIIPSKNLSNLIPCVEAVRKHELNRIPCVEAVRKHELNRIIWVDDRDSREYEDHVPVLDAARGYLDFIRGRKPFIFARNCNLAIKHAGDDDVILLNDDALLETPGGFSKLAACAKQYPEFGVIAATCNNVGNLNQQPQGFGLREEPRAVCFVAVLIPRRTIDLVGLLDERFTGYGYEDDDYCARVRRAGLKIGIHDGCYVNHGALKSTFRGGAYPHEGFDRNQGLFLQKWGSFSV